MYFHYKQNTNLLHYINVLEITCREIFGDLILSKLIHLDKYKLKMYISIFPYMITTVNYPPISIIYGKDDYLPDFFKEQKKIEGCSDNPISHPDFSTYLLNSIENSYKLIYVDKFNEIKEITDKLYVTYSLSETIEIINNTYQKFLLL